MGTGRVYGAPGRRVLGALVLAPALVSEGKGEGSGTFTMSGPLPAKLGEGARLEGGFKIEKGVLGSFDLSRALQTSGGQATGRTIFTELSGQVVYVGRGCDPAYQGGVPLDPQIKALRAGVEILVATPGRLLDQLLGIRGKVVATLICGDNFFNEQTESALSGIKAEASELIWMNLPPARVWVYRGR